MTILFLYFKKLLRPKALLFMFTFSLALLASIKILDSLSFKKSFEKASLSNANLVPKNHQQSYAQKISKINNFNSNNNLEDFDIHENYIKPTKKELNYNQENIEDESFVEIEDINLLKEIQYNYIKDDDEDVDNINNTEKIAQEDNNYLSAYVLLNPLTQSLFPAEQNPVATSALGPGQVLQAPDSEEPNKVTKQAKILKPENNKAEDIKPENIKTEDIKPDNNKTEDIKPDNNKTDDIKPDDNKTEDPKSDNNKVEDIKIDNNKDGNNKADNNKDDIKDDIKDDNNKVDNNKDDIKTDNNKTEDIKKTPLKPWNEYKLDNNNQFLRHYLMLLSNKNAPAEEIPFRQALINTLLHPRYQKHIGVSWEEESEDINMKLLKKDFILDYVNEVKWEETNYPKGLFTYGIIDWHMVGEDVFDETFRLPLRFRIIKGDDF